VIDGYQADVVAIASKLQAGELSLAEWQLQTAQALKALHVATAVAANGGFNNMSQSDYGFVGSLVKKQYAYLRDFAGDIASGKQLVAGSGFPGTCQALCPGREGDLRKCCNQGGEDWRGFESQKRTGCRR
jgi:hypothetical protein